MTEWHNPLIFQPCPVAVFPPIVIYTRCRCDMTGAISDATRIGGVSQCCDMSLTLEQRTNHDGVPKAAELIEITGAHALEASDRAILNLLYQHAHDSGRLGDPTATWEMPITALRPSRHNGTDRIRDSLSRLLSVQVKVAYREVKTGRDRVLMTHLFESFDIPADEGLVVRCVSECPFP